MENINYMNIGFIGYGNMASAILKGILNNNLVPPKNISVYDINISKTADLSDINIYGSIEDVCKKSDIIFLCVKPDVLLSILPNFDEKNKAYISIAAGITQETLQKNLPKNSRVMRVMPNMPLLVGKGAVCIQAPNNLTDKENEFIEGIFSSIGCVEKVDGSLMDAVTGVSGSGPAYVYLFIKSLAEAGIKNGLPEDIAHNIALKTFEGACDMLRQTGRTPEELIDTVCSPGGTTLAAMQVFKENNIDRLIDDAVGACIKRSKELSK